jgi:chromosome segregation protein
VQADLRDARARVLAEDVVSARETWQHELARSPSRGSGRDELEHRLDAARSTESIVNAALADDAATVGGGSTDLVRAVESA